MKVKKDEDAGVAWLNKVRNARSLQGVEWYYESTLESEYMRDYRREGQLFFISEEIMMNFLLRMIFMSLFNDPE